MQYLIYKLTNKLNNRFYVGQHSGNKFHTYWGSGSIWVCELKGLKNKFPKCWRKLIKREILFNSKDCSQNTLDVMEKYFIKKEKALHSLNLGGCNILIGTSNAFASGSPMKDYAVRKKQSESMKKFFIDNPEKARKMKEKRTWTLNNTDYKQRISNTLKGRYVGNKNPNYGNNWSEEQKENLSKKMKGRYVGNKNPNYDNKWSEEQKQKFSEKKKEFFKSNPNPMYNKVRITNGKINTVIKKRR